MIKFLDLLKVNERFRTQIDERLKEVLDSGWYIYGKQDELFESNFVKYIGANYPLSQIRGIQGVAKSTLSYFRRNTQNGIKFAYIPRYD